MFKINIPIGTEFEYRNQSLKSLNDFLQRKLADKGIPQISDIKSLEETVNPWLIENGYEAVQVSYFISVFRGEITEKPTEYTWKYKKEK